MSFPWEDFKSKESNPWDDFSKEETKTSTEKKSVTGGLFGTFIGENSETLRKARIPQQVVSGVSEGMMDAIEPETQSVALNALLRTPQTIASFGADRVSDFVSPENVVTYGALKGAQSASPAIKAVGRAIGSGAEKLSGLGYKTPGILAEVTNNPGLPFKPGVEAANETYAQMVDPTQIRESMKVVLGKKEFVEQAIQFAKDGTLTADEALIARQGLDQIKNTVPRPVFFNVRDILDNIAKTKFAGADEARTIASKAEALRNVFPLNKGGTPSRLGQLVQGASVVGAKFNPYALATAPLISPRGQALVASGIGIARKVAAPIMKNPSLSAYIASIMANKGKKK